jgi:hypothetical protein
MIACWAQAAAATYVDGWMRGGDRVEPMRGVEEG